MSDSVQPHRRQPTRFPCPWDFPGKNTGVGCHFLLQCTKVKSESEVAQSGPTLRPHGLQPTRLLRPWDFPGKRTEVGCHCLLQGGAFRSLQLEWEPTQSNEERSPKLFSSPGDLSHPGIKPRFPALQADSLPFEPPGYPVGYQWRSDEEPGFLPLCLPSLLE